MRLRFKPNSSGAFSFADFLVVLAVLALLLAVLMPVLARSKSKARKAVCIANLGQVSRAIFLYAESSQKTLPAPVSGQSPGVWWWYKEQVKGFIGLKGPSTAQDRVFACPSDRGYSFDDSVRPFSLSAKFDYGSYVFNGVNLPGVPNLAGRDLGTIVNPARTLLVMEWTAHAPLSWHDSRTGKANYPFYNDAQSVVAFVDGRVDYIKMYYDGMNAAYTRDPIPGYYYNYSGD